MTSKKCDESKFKKLTMHEFLSNCGAYGNNWSAMIISGIETLSKEDCRFKSIYDSMPEDKEYEFVELLQMISPYVMTTTKKAKKS